MSESHTVYLLLYIRWNPKDFIKAIVSSGKSIQENNPLKKKKKKIRKITFSKRKEKFRQINCNFSKRKEKNRKKKKGLKESREKERGFEGFPVVFKEREKGFQVIREGLLLSFDSFSHIFLFSTNTTLSASIEEEQQQLQNARPSTRSQ